MFIHLFRYQVAPGREAEFTSLLRASSSPRSARPAGLVAAWDGRRLGHDTQEYVSASLWQSEGSFLTASPGGLVPAYLLPFAELLRYSSHRSCEVVGEPILGHGGRVLRVFAVYAADAPDPSRTAEALARLRERMTGEHGPLTFVMGIDTAAAALERAAPPAPGTPPPAVSGIAVSTWQSWDDLLAVTGARVGQPVTDEIGDRPRSIEHYETMHEIAPHDAGEAAGK